jgi:hypothetical protein
MPSFISCKLDSSVLKMEGCAATAAPLGQSEIFLGSLGPGVPVEHVVAEE